MNPTGNFFQIDENSWRKVAKNFNKTLKDIDQDVALLQQWLKTQPHLPDLLDSHCIRNFLLLNKFSIELCKQKIDNYYTLRLKFEEEYGKSNPKLEFNKLFCKEAYMEVYPNLTPEMYRITYFKVKPNLTLSYDPLNGIKRFLIMQELRLRTDIMFGDVLAVDYTGFPLSLLPKLTPALIQTAALLYEKIYSNRLKALYMINVPPFMSTMMSLLKKIMKPKIFDRIHLLENADALKEFIPLELLPTDFGGKGLSLDTLQEKLNNLCEEEFDLFNRLDEIKIDESLRPEKLKNDDDMGLYGSFKKLNVD